MSLFKFFSFNNNNLSSFADRKLWFSKVNAFNDPFEGLFIHSTKRLSSGQTIDVIRTMNKDGEINKLLKIDHQSETMDRLTDIAMLGQLDTLREITEETLKIAFDKAMDDIYDAGVCCFISDKNIQAEYSNPIQNQLMWGYYGDGLRGYALEMHEPFECNDKISCVSVEYIKDIPTIDTSDFGYKFYTSTSQQDRNNLSSKLVDLIASKSDLWKHENEIRFISQKGNALVSYSEGSVKALYIGEKMPEWQQTALVSIAKKNGITDIYTAYIRKERYELSIERYVK
ncbi:DUF2971 domain-containing protein [Aeromonas sp. 603404]|uniref:DUF2971 domain-containing protein n=1 Tax=Aeromonas sp. 603404 TaxID=2712047 RepID=UPI003BA3AA9D